ncbi:hypothetical protein E4T44_13130, partial [Aureobasidium sp. EXF-8845]
MGVDSCEYAVNPGETRFTALKRKNASLVMEVDRMHGFIEALRSASPGQTQDMLQDLRTGHGTDQVSSILTLSQVDFHPPPLHHRNPHSFISSGPSPHDTDAAQTPRSSCSRSSSSNTGSVSSSTFEDDVIHVGTPCQLLASHAMPLPDIDALRKCVKAFYTDSGKLFHVFPPSHIEVQFQILSGRGHEKVLRLAACELCAVGALGSQYIKESLPEGTAQNMYSDAKHLLEDLVTVDSNRAAKVCVMLGIFNIMNKEKVAMTFVEMGLNLLSRPPMAQVCPPDMERSLWTELRRTWRVLVFLEAWLSSTLGYVSGLNLPKDAMNLKTFEIEGETNLEEKVTTEMIKIAVIRYNMLRLSLSFKGLSALTVETITKELQSWYHNLPHEIRLAEPENNPEISFELRRTICYVNFLYFGSRIMLLRRVLHSMDEQSNLFAEDGNLINNLMAQANSAARESAKLFRQLYVVGGNSQRCWVYIFQAYSSSVLILHHVAVILYERHIGGRSSSELEEDLHLARACLDFLGLCRQKDVAARQFHSTLSHFYATLYSTATGQLEFGSDVVSTAR